MTSSVFQTLVIIQLADARLFCYEGKVKTGRLQSVIGHVATPPQGVGSAWGKDLAPPERPGVRADRAVPGAETDTQRPLSLSCLPPPSSPLSNSFKQPLTSFLTHRRSKLPLSPLLPHLKGVKTRTAVRCYNVFPKFPEKLPAAGCQVPVGHVCVWEPCCILSQPASFTRKALNMDAKEWNCVHDKTLTHVSVRNMAEYVQTYVRSDGLLVSRGGQYGKRGMQV